MKHPVFSRKNRRLLKSQAIVSVLILMVLITAVILGFLITSDMEQTSSRSYKASSDARLMADRAINLVQGEINEATSLGITNSWASQPGAIRTYDNTGALHEIYKLYSAQTLTTNAASGMNTTNTTAGSNDMPPTSWASDPALWVDLNASAMDAQGTNHYPILDPSQAANVDGFSINSAPGIATATSVPMPVQWLYVLQNGQIIPPDTGSNGTVVTFNSAAVQPSASNPIVGRIAYWTDDETCKVNVNTAGGDGVLASPTDPTPIANATFWDTPHFSAPDEATNAWFQPASGEYQRYPGHPGTVALNNILHGLGWNLGTAPSANFYALTPRYGLGGSEASTLNIASAAPVTFKSSPANRLYPSVAEMLFQATGSPSRNASVLNNSDALTRQKIETARFFLTAHSQAPEVTLSGQPRVSIWPVWSTSPSAINAAGSPLARTPIDNVLAFTATVPGTTPSTYYFTRYDSTSATTDIGLTEANGQQRNQMLLNYLDYFTSSTQPIPGYGGSFDSKYTQTGKRQILAEIFDYIRTINEADTSQLAVGATSNPWGYVTARYIPAVIPGWQNFGGQTGVEAGEYQIAPSMINSTNAAYLTSQGWFPGTLAGYQGFGSYPRLNEVAIHFIAMARGGLPASANFPKGVLPIPMYVGYTTNTYNAYFAPGDPGTSPNPAQNTALTAINTLVLDTNSLETMPPNPRTVDPYGGYAGVHNAENSSPQYWMTPGSEMPGSTSTMAVQAFILLDFIQPAQMLINDGTSYGVHPFLWVEIKGLNGFKIASSITGTPYNLGFTPDDIVLMEGDQGGSYMPGTLDNINFGDMMARTIGHGVLTGNVSSPNSVNPFFSSIIPLSIDPTTGTGNMIFTGGPITVNLYDGAGTSNVNAASSTWVPSQAARLVSSYTINFGATNGGTTPTQSTLPIPSLVPATNGTTAVSPPTGSSVGQGTPEDRWFPPAIAAPNAMEIRAGDVVQSMILSPQWSDVRMLAIPNVPPAAFTTHPNWGQTNGGEAWAYGLVDNDNINYSPTGSPSNPSFTYTNQGVLNPNANYITNSPGPMPYVPATVTRNYVTSNFGSNGQLMDWDNGIGSLPDGPWINKVDEGELEPDATHNHVFPYYTSGGVATAAATAFFSPNREVPSPGVFGSLPTGVDPLGVNPHPWQTLLFRPNPGHVGATSPADHLLLDLFWMPQAEPYAISEPFSSAGKINLNYQIQPFTYINRSTALRAVLNTQKIADVASTQGQTYKEILLNTTTASAIAANVTTPIARYPINTAATLAQFDDKFNGSNTSGVNSSTTPDIFHSASQICEMYLVPITNVKGGTYATSGGASSFAADWYDGKTFGLVGDNVRERPYADIYGLVTTKSNTFTVYYTVQSLKNAEPAANQATWNESAGTVLGEYRGSTTLERYIDPNQSLPDFAATPGAATLDGNAPAGTLSYYKWRVVENHQFAP